MKQGEKLLIKLNNKTYTSWTFSEFQTLLNHLGFTHMRTRGSHHVYSHPNMETPFSAQPKGKDAKPYQLRQLHQWLEGLEE